MYRHKVTLALFSVTIISSRFAFGQSQPAGGPWQWTDARPFHLVAEVKASSEDAWWPASRVMDGDTSEPAGL